MGQLGISPSSAAFLCMYHSASFAMPGSRRRTLKMRLARYQCPNGDLTGDLFHILSRSRLAFSLRGCNMSTNVDAINGSYHGMIQVQDPKKSA